MLPEQREVRLAPRGQRGVRPQPQGRVRQPSVHAFMVVLHNVNPAITHLPPESDPAQLFLGDNLPEGISHVIGQIEVGNENNQLHWQLYVQTNMAMTATRLKERMGWSPPPPGVREFAYVLVAYGTPLSCRQYVTKIDTRVPNGYVPGHLGMRTEVNIGRPNAANAAGGYAAVIDDMKQGMQWGELNDKYPSEFVRMFNGLRKQYERLNPPRRRDEVTCYLHWGITGSGKTHDVFAKFGEENVCKIMCPRIGQQLWFDGYEDQEVLMLDEFCGERTGVMITELLQITDKYPYRAKIHHGTVSAQWTVVVFTSNVPFEQWYPNATAAQVEALARRLPPENRIYYGTKYVPPRRQEVREQPRGFETYEDDDTMTGFGEM
jgi:hypothetical protein